MDIKPIKTEADYRATLREVESLMTAEPGTLEGERLDVLATLVEAYERKHFPDHGSSGAGGSRFTNDCRPAESAGWDEGRTERIGSLLL